SRLPSSAAGSLSVAHYASAGFSLSGVSGAWRRRTPVASKTALARAAATGRIELSPAPAGGRSGRFRKYEAARLGRLGDVEDRVGRPVGAGDPGAVEGDLLRQGAARALDDVAFDAAPEPVRVDDQPAIMGHGELARPDLAAAAVDFDLGDDRHHRT